MTLSLRRNSRPNCELSGRRGPGALSASRTLSFSALFPTHPCRLTISAIQIGANGDVHPFDTG
jgi:hypothetical protein